MILIRLINSKLNGKIIEKCQKIIYLFGVLRRFQHCTGHITTGSWKGRGYQCIQFVRVLYCKLPTNGKQLPDFPLEASEVGGESDFSSISQMYLAKVYKLGLCRHFRDRNVTLHLKLQILNFLQREITYRSYI